jgi:ribosomal protein S30
MLLNKEILLKFERFRPSQPPSSPQIPAKQPVAADPNVRSCLPYRKRLPAAVRLTHYLFVTGQSL